MSLFEIFLFWCYKCYPFIFFEILTILNLLPDCYFISRSLSMNSPMREMSLKILYFLYVVKFILEIVIFSTFFSDCAMGYGGYHKGWYLSCICPSHVEVPQPQTCSYITVLAWDFSGCAYQLLSPHVDRLEVSYSHGHPVYPKPRQVASRRSYFSLFMAGSTLPGPTSSREPTVPLVGSANRLPPLTHLPWIPPQRESFKYYSPLEFPLISGLEISHSCFWAWICCCCVFF